jgi:hypothetical protein
MKNKTLQIHKINELHTLNATPEQVVEFLEAFRLLQSK